MALLLTSPPRVIIFIPQICGKVSGFHATYRKPRKFLVKEYEVLEF